MKRFDGLAWSLVASGQGKSEPFVPDMPVAKLRTLFERDSWFMQACFTLRDKVAFHVDAAPLLAWLDKQPADQAICLFSQGGQYVKDIISDGPLEMLDEEARKVIDTREFMTTLGLVVAALPRLLDAMIHGFAARHGLAADFALKDGHHIVHFYDPTLTGKGAS